MELVNENNMKNIDKCIYSISKKYLNSYFMLGYTIDDVIQIGRIGALKAQKTFNPNNKAGAKWGTWFYTKVLAEILVNLRDDKFHEHYGRNKDKKALSSLNFKINKNGENDVEIQHVIEDVKSNFSDKVVENISLGDAINNLSKLEKIIIKEKYFNNRTQTEIAKMLNVNQTMISRKEKKALLKLKEVLS